MFHNLVHLPFTSMWPRDAHTVHVTTEPGVVMVRAGLGTLGKATYQIQFLMEAWPGNFKFLGPEVTTTYVMVPSGPCCPFGPQWPPEHSQ